MEQRQAGSTFKLYMSLSAWEQLSMGYIDGLAVH